MIRVAIVIKEYNEILAKRQPWYSIRCLKEAFEAKGCNVDVLQSVKQSFHKDYDFVFVTFSLKYIFTSWDELKKWNFILTFPLYRLNKLKTIPAEVLYKDFKDLWRIILGMILYPYINYLFKKKTREVIVLSDRQEALAEHDWNCIKFYPFKEGNWIEEKVAEKAYSHELVLGYFGPPFETRDYTAILEACNYLTIADSRIKAKFIVRTERDSLLKAHDKKVKKYLSNKNLSFITGFLDRSTLQQELLGIDVLLLTFSVVMSELPVVVLEALELGIPVITTSDCGLETLAQNTRGLYVLRGNIRSSRKELLEIIAGIEKPDYALVKEQIQKVNTNLIEYVEGKI